MSVVEGSGFLVNGPGSAVAVASVGPGRMRTVDTEAGGFLVNSSGAASVKLCRARKVDIVVELADSAGPILELLPDGQHWTGAGLEQNPDLTEAPRHVCSAVSMHRPGWPYLHHQTKYGIIV